MTACGGNGADYDRLRQAARPPRRSGDSPAELSRAVALTVIMAVGARAQTTTHDALISEADIAKAIEAVHTVAHMEDTREPLRLGA